MIALDTNLLVYAHRAKTRHHARARRAVEQAAGRGDGWGLAVPSVAEFWAVVTHPANERPSTGEEASAFVRALVEDGAEIWQPGPGFGGRLVQQAADLSVAGARVFDLQIALTAFENGATELWTHDAGFVRLPGLLLHDPLI